jgi:hypothetical protein
MGVRQNRSLIWNFFIRSWWVIVFSTITVAFYFQAAHSKTVVFSNFNSQLHEMEKEKMAALHEQEELSLQLQSESDPAWIELMLMKELGVVPEGWTKVYFGQ